MAFKIEVRETPDFDLWEAEITRLRCISAIKNWVYARNNKKADTKWPLIDAAREVTLFFILEDKNGTPYIPSNRLAWLGTNVIRVSPIETCTPAQAVCLAHKDYLRAYEEQLGRPYEG